MKLKWRSPLKDARSLAELQARLRGVEDEIEELREERNELEARITELERLDLDDELADRARQLLDDSHTEYLCWPEISALESLLVSPTIALIKRTREILGNHNRLYA